VNATISIRKIFAISFGSIDKDGSYAGYEVMSFEYSESGVVIHGLFKHNINKDIKRIQLSVDNINRLQSAYREQMINQILND